MGCDTLSHRGLAWILIRVDCDEKRLIKHRVMIGRLTRLTCRIINLFKILRIDKRPRRSKARWSTCKTSPLFAHHPPTYPPNVARSIAKLTMSLEHPPLSALSRCMFRVTSVSHLRSLNNSLVIASFLCFNHVTSVVLFIFTTRHVKLNDYAISTVRHDKCTQGTHQRCSNILVRKIFSLEPPVFCLRQTKSAFSGEMFFATVFRPADGQSMWFSLPS